MRKELKAIWEIIREETGKCWGALCSIRCGVPVKEALRRWLGVLVVLATVAAQGATNWNSMPDMAETPASWTYAQSPGVFFWAGFGVVVTAYVIGWAWRFAKGLDREGGDTL